MTTIDKNGAKHDNLGRYAEQHQTAAPWDLTALGGDLNPPTTEGESDLKDFKKEDFIRIGAGVAVAAVAVTGIASCSRGNDAGPPDPGPSATALVETPEPDEPVVSTPACEAGTIVAWDDIETVRETLPDGCEIRLLGPVPEPETAGERSQRLFEWVLAGNASDDLPEIELVYPDGIIVDTTQEVSTEIGELIPSYRVEDARAAGASVYVSPRGDRSGLVIDPNGPLPEQVRADIQEVAR